ncbi:Sjogren's syndrome/scleroderma autoantigen 1 family protein [uncultured Methanoregula sp.]|uniref:Sjogren's syndrome/scleroderma autoantigen 1 family protein n=1 Tax=uncultured Methanoregula sp. TaxID=1005933 RepID=UPI002AAC2B95|nr:Sjogren's syndrome/scleroderma autoantigen 1 family protein [uncultured Methanoregula sp.]
MAEYLLKGGKMLEKSCKTCGCPLFEVKGKTICVVCAENGPAKNADATPRTAAAEPAAHPHNHEHGETCSCGEDHDEDSCECEESGLTEELAFTIHSLCLRIQNERDPNQVLTLMNAVKSGTEALEVLCRL